MGCVTYDIACNDCGWHSLERSPELNCEKCKSENLHTIREFDEQEEDE